MNCFLEAPGAVGPFAGLALALTGSLALAALINCVVALVAAFRVRRSSCRPDPDPPHAPKPPIDGVELGYVHPLGWPVRIIQGLPVAIGPHGHSRLWCARTGSWAWCPEVLADEARERLKLEDTQVMPSAQAAHSYRFVYIDSAGNKSLPAGWVNWNHQ